MKAQPPRALQTSADLEAMVAKAREASEFLKALARESRPPILCPLAGGEKSVSELEALLSQRQSTVSQQMARLRFENLVAAWREGATIYYRLTNEKVRTSWRQFTKCFARLGTAPTRRPRAAPAAISRSSPSSACRCRAS